MSYFEDSLFRFGTSGTLILFYSLTDRAARRAASDAARGHVVHPRWLSLAVFVSLTAFYLCIKPFGGALWDGFGNALGILMCFVAMALRWGTRAGHDRVRMPEVAARMAFYAALPLAVGVPLGWLVLSAPAIAASAVVCVQQDRAQLAAQGADYALRMRHSARWIPGIF